MSDVQIDGLAGFDMDANLEAGDGIKVQYSDELSFTIRRAGGANRAYGQLLSAKLRPLQRRIDMGMLPDEVANKVLAEVYAKTIVQGWTGIKSRGEDLPFSIENAIALFTSQPEVFRTIQAEATSAANFRKQAA
ncbi:MAG: hypothetical protein KF735_08585 [Chelatococcus sp.]|uniref:hypothetical protein n=1 Tax=Chelatococcus sp. TaxID=1953771 RepID=UPI0025BD63C7|nr:hypothetical protein [Chelatococcus sp.]MBX3537680.1 hypothetical protein [Chelatococcus sp.]